MTNRVQTNRLSTPGSRPAAGSRAPGELYINYADMQLGAIDESKTPNDMIAIRFFSSNTSYVAGDLVVQGGHMWHANQAVPAGPFNPAQWDQNTTNVSGPYLPLTGGIMTGALTLAADPTGALGAATKEYVDARVPLIGGTMTGPLILSGPPTVTNGAATKGYVDGLTGAYLPITGGTLAGPGNLTVNGTATFVGAVTANAGVTSIGTIQASLLQTSGANNGHIVYDRSGNGNYSIFYRNGNTTAIANSVGGGNMISWDASNNASILQNLTVGGTGIFTGILESTSTIESVSSAQAGFYCHDRDNYGVASMLYGSGNRGTLWRSNVGDCFYFGASGNCSSAGQMTVGAQLNVNGSYVLAQSLTTWGAQFGAAGGYPLYVHSPSGTNTYMNFTMDGVRSWYNGPGSDQVFRIYDASAGHLHISCNPTNNQIVLGGGTNVAADSICPSGMLRSGTVNGYVANGISSTTSISNYASFGHDVQNGNSYLSQYTINGQAAGVGSVTTNGTNTFFNTACDGRRKKNIRPMVEKIDVGKLIDAIAPVAFQWTNVPDEPADVGFVAQDLHKVVPNVVRPGSDDEPDLHPWSADYSKLVPYMIAEIQALRKRVAELEASHG